MANIRAEASHDWRKPMTSSIDPTKVFLHIGIGDVSLCDGVHYVVKGILTKNQHAEMLAEIVHCINTALIDHLVPAGLMRGVLSDFPIQHMLLEEQDRMIAHGVNPIILRNGKTIIWGNNFVFQGGIYPMFGMFRCKSAVHPYLMNFVSEQDAWQLMAKRQGDFIEGCYEHAARLRAGSTLSHERIEKVERARKAFCDALSCRVNMGVRLGDVPVQVVREAIDEALKAIQQ